MSDLPRSSAATISSYRIDSTVNEELMQGQRSRVLPPRGGVLEMLPEPVFPQKPQLFATPDGAFLPKNGKRHWTAPQIYHAMQGWMFPYFRLEVANVALALAVSALLGAAASGIPAFRASRVRVIDAVRRVA